MANIRNKEKARYFFMEQLILKSSKSNLYSNALRIVFGAIGILYLFMGLSEMHPDWDLKTGAVLNSILGLFFIITVILNPTFGANIELILNDDFLRTTEDLALTRTAYWSKLHNITLHQFSLKIHYQSGASEKFRLPYLNSDEFEELRQQINDQAEKHQFKVAEKSWWNVF